MGNRYDDDRFGRGSQYGGDRDRRVGERDGRRDEEFRRDFGGSQGPEGRGYEGRGYEGRGYEGRGYEGRGYEGRGNEGRGYEGRGEGSRDDERNRDQYHGENRFDWGTQPGSRNFGSREPESRDYREPRGGPGERNFDRDSAYRAAAGWGGTGWGGGAYGESRSGFPGRDPNTYTPSPRFNAPTRWGQPDDQYWQGQQAGAPWSRERSNWQSDFDRDDERNRRQGWGSSQGSGGSQNWGVQAQHGAQSAFETVKEGIRNAFRGLKGYTRSDERIQEDVSDRINHLAERSGIDAGEIEVKVQNGEVTLNGTIASRHHKHLIENEAGNVSGVHDVHNLIRVRREGGSSLGQAAPASNLAATGSQAAATSGTTSGSSALSSALSAGADPNRTRTPNGSTQQQNS